MILVLLIYFMTNTGLEVQKIIIQSAKNIEFLADNNIDIFASVPSRVKMPYIKIAGISMDKIQPKCSIKSFTIDLFIATNSKNNRQILDITEVLYDKLPNEILHYATDNNITIYNVYNINYSIKEDLQNTCWNGHFCLDIDLLEK